MYKFGSSFARSLLRASRPAHSGRISTLPIISPRLTSVAPSSSFAQQAPVGGFTYPAPRKLEDITKLPLLQKHTADRVEKIWREYHDTHKTAFGDLLTDQAYELLLARSKRCPLFVIPVRRNTQSFFTLLLQFQGKQILFTFLEDYKRNAAGAMPYFTMTMFDEFVTSKQIALLRADVTNMMTRDEAKTVWDLVKMFYLSEGKIGFDSVVKFNQRPNEFDFDIVMRVAGIK